MIILLLGPSAAFDTFVHSYAFKTLPSADFQDPPLLGVPVASPNALSQSAWIIRPDPSHF